MDFYDSEQVSIKSQINGEDDRKILPLLTEHQEQDINDCLTDSEKVNRLLFHLSINPNILYPDKQAEQISTAVKIEDMAEELYWTMKIYCEDNSMYFFNHISFYELFAFLYPIDEIGGDFL